MTTSITASMLYNLVQCPHRLSLDLHEDPDVAAKEQIKGLFNPDMAVDLYYDVVLPYSEWPTNDHSIKTLASYLGFKWRDASPSGAESIEWYHRWIETADPEIRQRILAYNQDDCIATRVLLDGIRTLGGLS